MFRLWLFFSAVTLAFHAWAAQPEKIAPQGDLTAIAFDGRELSMLHTTIDLNNAHPIDTISFFSRNAAGPAEHIPFEVDGDYQPFLRLRSGADCSLSGIEVFRDDHELRIVYAHRKGNWTEKKPVTFVIFKLVINQEDEPGIPHLYFRQQRSMVSKRLYCDAYQALQDELPLLMKKAR